MNNRKELKFLATEGTGEVSALLDYDDNSKALLVLAHGAGAGMSHMFMEHLSQVLLRQEIGVFRFNFPYMEHRKGRPDPPARAVKTIESAVHTARKMLPGLPIFVGGKSFGGRMATHLAAKNHLLNLKGLVLVGFPLHAPGKPGIERAAHLKDIEIPMLFLQGSRDSLATPELIKQVTGRLKQTKVILYPGADHSFKVLKSLNISPEEMMATLCDDISDWIREQIG